MGVNATGTLGGSQVERRRRENRCAVGGEGGWVWEGAVLLSRKFMTFSKWCDMVHSICVVFKIHECVFISSAEGEKIKQQQQQPFNGRLSGTTRVGRYQKKHSPAHTHPGQRTSFITFLHLHRSTASSLFSLRA